MVMEKLDVHMKEWNCTLILHKNGLTANAQLLEEKKKENSMIMVLSVSSSCSWWW
jgi:hypothetical protein